MKIEDIIFKCKCDNEVIIKIGEYRKECDRCGRIWGRLGGDLACNKYYQHSRPRKKGEICTI
jgi:hypothetical protein